MMVLSVLISPLCSLQHSPIYFHSRPPTLHQHAMTMLLILAVAQLIFNPLASRSAHLTADVLVNSASIQLVPHSTVLELWSLQVRDVPHPIEISNDE